MNNQFVLGSLLEMILFAVEMGTALYRTLANVLKGSVKLTVRTQERVMAFHLYLLKYVAVTACVLMKTVVLVHLDSVELNVNLTIVLEF